VSEKNRIRIGNQTSFSAPTVMMPFEYAMACGFDAFEWFPDKKETGEGWVEGDIPKDMRFLIKREALSHKITLSVHAPSQVNPLKRDTNELLDTTVEFSRDIGARLLNIHFYTGDGIVEYAKAIMPLVKHLARSGIKLSIENTPGTRPGEFNELFEYSGIRGLVHRGHIGMCFDLGHANLCDETRNDYIKYVEMLHPNLPVIHMHMHENYGDYDSHLPIFTGPAGKDASGVTEFMRLMRKRNFSGSIILEQWPQPESMLAESRKRLLDIIERAETNDRVKIHHEGERA